MKRNIILILLLITSLLLAHDFEDIEFGSDSTFEIITWNLEWFPKNGETTVDYVKQIIAALDSDFIAFQEIDDFDYFQQMVDEIPNYDGYFVDSEYSGLAFIYKETYIVINEIYQIYTSQPYWRPFPRSPLIVEFTSAGKTYYAIDNHFKAGGDGVMNLDDPWDEETRRYDASNLLKEYIEENLEDENVFLIGDLNDILIDEAEHNVFQNFLNEPEAYQFADMEIAEGSSSNWSYPGWPSHLDHILITDELFDEFEAENSEVRTIKVDDYTSGGYYVYDMNISDHRPVGFKFENNTNPIEEIETVKKFNLTNYPNPFFSKTNHRNSNLNISFNIKEKDLGIIKVDIFDLKGRKVRNIFNKDINQLGEFDLTWNGRNKTNQEVSSGVYFIKLTTQKGFSEISKSLIIK